MRCSARRRPWTRESWKKINKAVGKIDNKEIDFIARKDGEKIYYQVTEDMTAESTRERELAPLRMVRDNYEKTIITLNTPSTASIGGINIVRLIDFLTE